MMSSREHSGAPLSLQPVTRWHAVWVPAALATFAFGLAALYLGVRRIDYKFPGLVREEFIDFVNLTGEANLPTWYSALLWQLAALLAFSVAQKHRAAGLPHVAYWIGMVPLFLFLSLDEAGKVHENVGDLIARRADLPDVFNYTFAWVLFGVGLVAAVGAVYLRLLLKLRPMLALLIVASAAIFIFASVGVESVSAAVWNGKLDKFPFGLTWGRMVALEETSEMLGVILLVHAQLRVLALEGSPYKQVGAGPVEADRGHRMA